MRLLALESSARAASVCVCEDGRLLAQTYQHTGLTHSETLLPMVDEMLQRLGMQVKELDALAVAVGPGSFTGLRIGIATVKGLAFASGLPCVGCSTLESMAYGGLGLRGVLCCAMDARRGEVYGAYFHSDGQRIRRLTEDAALPAEALAQMLFRLGATSCYVLGDGAEIAKAALEARGMTAWAVPENLRWQTAWGVAQLGLHLAQEGKLSEGEALCPQYLRLSQAERERIARSEQAEKK